MQAIVSNTSNNYQTLWNFIFFKMQTSNPLFVSDFKHHIHMGKDDKRHMGQT